MRTRDQNTMSGSLLRVATYLGVGVVGLGFTDCRFDWTGEGDDHHQAPLPAVVTGPGEGECGIAEQPQP